MLFQDQVAIVTGGSRGIGRAIVADLAARGARVFFTYHAHADAAEETSRATGATARSCPQEDSDAIARTVEEIVAQTGRLDILVNNAGIRADKFILMMPESDWQKVIDVNLSGAWRWAKAVSRPMLGAGRGSIVNVGPVAGSLGLPGQTNYAATKAAIMGMTRVMGKELGKYGITVNAVAPGSIMTDMYSAVPEEVKQKKLAAIPLRRYGDPEEAANLIAFLASDESSYITAQTIVIDGGFN